MLLEIKNVRQEPAPGRRRWFESDGFDLVVWFDAADRVTGFQICYDFGSGEHALTWRENRGFAHAEVDPGDANPLKNETPVLTPAAEVPWADIARVFDERSSPLEASLRDVVHDKLANRAGANASG